MRFWIYASICGLILPGLAGCVPLDAGERNAFLTLTELFGTPTAADEDDQGAATGVAQQSEFRRTTTVTFANNNPDAELKVSFAAWVNISSIRSAEQQDALLNSGYVQLSREVQLGSVFSLPPGTFVFNGPGVGGATKMVLAKAQQVDDDPIMATTRDFTIITPDVILAFFNPPVSCDSVAFSYTLDGDPVTAVPVADPESPFSGATGEGGFKTLAQVDVYQCDPFRPGLFLKLGGGVTQTNEYFEGENVRFDYFAVPDADGNFANVTISE